MQFHLSYDVASGSTRLLLRISDFGFCFKSCLENLTAPNAQFTDIEGFFSVKDFLRKFDCFSYLETVAMWAKQQIKLILPQ